MGCFLTHDWDVVKAFGVGTTDILGERCLDCGGIRLRFIQEVSEIPKSVTDEAIQWKHRIGYKGL